jgi:hypothetical protein
MRRLPFAAPLGWYAETHNVSYPVDLCFCCPVHLFTPQFHASASRVVRPTPVLLGSSKGAKKNSCLIL